MAGETPSFATRLGWRLEALAFDIFSGLLRLFPVDAVSAMGGWLLRTLGPLTGEHRIADLNLRLAFPDMSEAERRWILKGQWDNLGRTAFEFAIMDRITPESGRVDAVGGDRVLELAQQGRPIVMFSGHFANWEAMAAAAAQAGLKLRISYRRANNPHMDKRIVEGRLQSGIHLFAPKGKDGNRELIAALKRGEILGFLNDQRDNAGVEAPFFGHMVRTAPGPVRLALSNGAVLRAGVREAPEGRPFHRHRLRALRAGAHRRPRPRHPGRRGQGQRLHGRAHPRGPRAMALGPPPLAGRSLRRAQAPEPLTGPIGGLRRVGVGCPTGAVGGRVTGDTTSLAGRLGWRLEALAYDTFVWALRLLPVDAISAMGGALMRTLGPLLREHRIADLNLRLAFPEMPQAERRRVLKGHWDNFGRTAFEFAVMDRITPATGRVEAFDPGPALEMIRQGRPVVLFTGHFANWEALPSAASAGGLSLRISYRRANNPHMDKRIVEGRKRMGVHLFAAKGKDGNRELIQALKNGEMLAILWDQRDSAGVEAPFFGHQVRTASGPVRLALAHDGVLIGIGMRRLEGARFTSRSYAPIELERTGDRTRDIQAGIAKVNAFMEARIREAPEQWLWAHRRWPVEVYRSAEAEESLGRAGPDQQHRVEVAALPFQPPAQVRAGGAALLADRADPLAAAHQVALADVDPGQVQILADQALAVVDQDQPALEVQAPLGQRHPAVGWRRHRRAGRRSHVDAVVRPLGIAVQDPLAAEPAREAVLRQRQGEARAEGVEVGSAGEALRLARGLGLDPRQQRRVRRRDLVVRQAVDALDVEVALGDRERAAGLT